MSLTDHELAAVEALKTRIEHEFGVSMTDRDYMRFLRARSLDAESAYVQAKNYLAWKKDKNVDTILERELPLRDLIQIMCPVAHHKLSKEGFPIFIQKYGSINVDALHEKGITDEQMVEFHVYDMQLVRRRCTEISDELKMPVEKQFNIIDLMGLGLGHLRGLHYLQAIISIDQNFYPECLGKMLVINAPAMFGVIWAVVKPMLDARTIDKIEIHGYDYHARLFELVEKDSLPVEYGGSCESCPNGCIPAPVFQETACVPAGRTFERKSDCPAAGCIFSWSFMTSDYDVEYSVTYQPANMEMQTIVESTRVSSNIAPVQGSHQASESGVWCITWDNSYSYWTSKELKFTVSVTQLPQSEN